MISSVVYTAPSPSTLVAITLADGRVWETDAGLPPDTDIRARLKAWRDAGGVIAPYVAPPAPVPQSISRRQCARQMLIMGLISPAEAVEMAQKAAPPAIVGTMLAAMPEPHQSLARIDFAAGAYERGNPLLIAVMTGTGATSSDIDDFFRAAAQA